MRSRRLKVVGKEASNTVRDLTSNPGFVIAPQYGPSKIAVFCGVKKTILKLVGNISFSKQIFLQTRGTQRLFSVKYLFREGNVT